MVYNNKDTLIDLLLHKHEMQSLRACRDYCTVIFAYKVINNVINDSTFHEKIKHFNFTIVISQN